jgi:hypothetical protein
MELEVRKVLLDSGLWVGFGRFLEVAEEGLDL